MISRVTDSLAGLSGINAGWSIKVNYRFKTKWPLALARPPSGG